MNNKKHTLQKLLIFTLLLTLLALLFSILAIGKISANLHECDHEYKTFCYGTYVISVLSTAACIVGLGVLITEHNYSASSIAFSVAYLLFLSCCIILLTQDITQYYQYLQYKGRVLADYLEVYEAFLSYSVFHGIDCLWASILCMITIYTIPQNRKAPPRILQMVTFILFLGYLVYSIFFYFYYYPRYLTALSQESTSINTYFILFWFMFILSMSYTYVIALKQKTNKIFSEQSLPLQTPHSTTDYANQLLQLQQLKTDDQISSEEYKKQRADILKKI